VGDKAVCVLSLRVFCIMNDVYWKPVGSHDTLLSLLNRCVPWFGLRDQVRMTNMKWEDGFRRTAPLISFMGMFLFFMWYFFAVVGMCLIEDAMSEINKLPNAPMNGSYGEMTNFATMASAMVSMFQVILTNNWNDLLYTAMAATNDWIAVFFILFYILTVLIMLNIFTSIVLQSFTMRDHLDILRGYKYFKEEKTLEVKMQGITYKVEPAGWKPGLDTHMELVDKDKEQLIQECLDSGVFDRVVNASEKELLGQRRILEFLGNRHKKAKGLSLDITSDVAREALSLSDSRPDSGNLGDVHVMRV